MRNSDHKVPSVFYPCGPQLLRRGYIVDTQCLHRRMMFRIVDEAADKNNATLGTWVPASDVWEVQARLLSWQYG